MISARFADLPEELASAYLELIEDRAGLRVSAQQARRLPEAVDRALHDSNEADPWRLLERLKSNHNQLLLDSLAAALTVGETHFLRVRPQIDALQHIVLPSILSARAKERRLAIWSAGCSSGEEPYTLAILARERLASAADWDIRLLATDINQAALRTAREGLYGGWSFRGTSTEYRDRYFREEGNRWRLAESIRRAVEFFPLNLIGDAYPRAPEPGFDLIVCRNVTIYFAYETTQRVYMRFFERLAPGGWLILGPSDPAPNANLGYEAVSAPKALLWRRPTGAAAAKRSEARNPERPAAQPRPAPPRPRPRPVDVRPAAKIAHPYRSRPEVRQGRETGTEDPSTSLTHLQLGVRHLDEGEPELALQSLRRATFLDPHDAFAQFTLGRAWLQAGEPELARRAFAHTLHLLDGLPDGTELAGTDIQVGDLRHAVEAELSVRFASPVGGRA